MRSVRKLFVLVCTIVVLAVLVPTATAATHKAFLVTKTCRTPDGYICTVQTSTFEAIPAGTEIWYVDVTPGNTLVQWATIRGPNGSATGLCDLSKSTATHVEGKCTFGAGTRRHGSLNVAEGWGTLTGFHLSVAVTGDANNVYSWTGTYWFN